MNWDWEWVGVMVGELLRLTAPNVQDIVDSQDGDVPMEFTVQSVEIVGRPLPHQLRIEYENLSGRCGYVELVDLDDDWDPVAYAALLHTYIGELTPALQRHNWVHLGRHWWTDDAEVVSQFAASIPERDGHCDPNSRNK